MMKNILLFLNPVAHLGEKDYSFIFPAITTILTIGILEFIAYSILHNPLAIGLAAIFVFIGYIVYFSFREGIRGGLVTAFLTVCYYLYIIYSRHYSGNALISALETTASLGVMYFFIAWIIGWLKQTIDILINREADEKLRLRTILHQLPVGVLIVDAGGSLILGNKQIETILGRKIREDTVTGADTIPNAYYNSKPLTPSQWPLAQTLSTGKAVNGKEIVIEHVDGKRKHVQISASLIHNREGKVIAAASIVNDITPQKELEERKDDFVNMASHELKTPITSMKLYVDTLMKRTKKSADRDTLRMMKGINDQTEKLQGLVNDLLDVSRLQTGKMTFTYDEFRLDELVAETIEGIKRSARNQEIVYIRKAPLKVTADKFRIYQVVANLLTNAIKYSPEGTKITVRVSRENGKAIVSVQDQGIGIPEAQQKKVFGRLYQVSGSGESSASGLGMGLYIAKEIIRKHHGTIWVESKDHKGSTFYFSLPLIK
jgi:PAS domain S-box-containing protein